MKARCIHCKKQFVALHASTNLCSDDCRRAHMRRYQTQYRERVLRQQLAKEQDDGRSTGRSTRGV
jgi:hypothetical protein